MGSIYTTAKDTSTNQDLYKVGSLRNLFDDTMKSIPQYYKELVNASSLLPRLLKGRTYPSSRHRMATRKSTHRGSLARALE
jgi:hypothetical protein